MHPSAWSAEEKHALIEVQQIPDSVVIAVDTEFYGPHTLTIQTAARLDPDTLVVQVYRSPAIPDLPADFDQEKYLPLTAEMYDRFARRIIVHPVELITQELSPARMVGALLGWDGHRILSRAEGIREINRFVSPGAEGGLLAPENVEWDKRGKALRVPSVELTLVGHFLRADFARIFGRQFYRDLKVPRDRNQAPVGIESRKLPRFVEQRRGFPRPPELEYCYLGDDFFGMSVATCDTMLPFGPASLDRHSQTFLKIRKSQVLDARDLQNMKDTFERKPHDAYGYAIADAVNQLLIHEQMKAKDREIYRSFGFTEASIPPFRSFQGGRVSTFLLAATEKDVAAGSQQLGSKQRLRGLMQKGGVVQLAAEPESSKFGPQTATVQGGLLFSRSPATLWHQSPGMLADVDLAGCYNAITQRMCVYWGRPVILEPGRRNLPLKDAVRFVSGLADDDGWMVWVSGDIGGYPNVLIPSTDDAVTGDNLAPRRKKRRQARKRAYQLEAKEDPGSLRDAQGARPYATTVRFGAVTWATWLTIQALPARVRKQYENLRAESIVFYPRELAAKDGTEFDGLVERHRSDQPSWEAQLDIEHMELIERRKIDADFVSLRFPLHEYAARIGRMRKEAQATEGKGSGLDLALKVHANAMYGVLASRYHPVNNFLAANLITASARSLAWAMSQSLNAIQTITDGCTFRRDQVPAIPYAECLKRKADYPLARAEDGGDISFQDPADIPTEDGAFTEWYRKHVAWFFGVEGSAEHKKLFGIHRLEHKPTPGTERVTFDGLGCDGSGNYLKAQCEEGEWKVVDFRARSYGKASKSKLAEPLLNIYRGDNLTELPPVAEDVELLSFDRAAQQAKAALDDGPGEVVFPLGFAHGKVLTYRIVKASAFVFETPEQRAKILKQIQKFQEATGCGLEVLALRRAYRDRRQGSIEDLLRILYNEIRRGNVNLTKALSLNKVPESVKEVALARKAKISGKKAEAVRWLNDMIDVDGLPAGAGPTSLVLRREDVENFRRDGKVIVLQRHPVTVPGPVLDPFAT